MHSVSDTEFEILLNRDLHFNNNSDELADGSDMVSWIDTSRSIFTSVKYDSGNNKVVLKLVNPVAEGTAVVFNNIRINGSDGSTLPKNVEITFNGTQWVAK